MWQWPVARDGQGIAAGTQSRHCTSGGSEANLHRSAVTPLTRGESRFSADGCRAFRGPGWCYISQESHLAWLKIAHATGIASRRRGSVATDGSGSTGHDALTAR